MRTRAGALVVAILAVSGCGGELSTARAQGQPAPVASATGALDVLVLDEKGRPIEGAVAWVPGVKPEGPLPAEPLVLEQHGLEFRPGFLAARRGRTLEVRNLDQEV